MAFGNDAPDVLRKLRDRYEPIRELGRGRLGAVWLAREKAGGRLVAIKVLRPPQQDEAILDRLADAVRDAGRLVHPNIVRVHELRRAPGDGAIAIVSQHVQGPTLKDVLRREAPLDPARV